MSILDHAEDFDGFREAVREWLPAAVPRGWRKAAQSGGEQSFAAIQMDWMLARAEVGLATPHWPRNEGGVGLGLAQQVLLANEFVRADAPPLPAFTVSLNHLPATLFAWGTEEQKKTYLPNVACGDIWCQGFSEPSAGSDLASLRCKAERRDGVFVINGQKIWSSYAAHAKHCILLARTDSTGRKQEGISFFVMDMDSLGVEVRTIRQATGRAEFCEIFLTDVEIPAENLVGAEGEGWKVAQSTLSAERGVLAFESVERIWQDMQIWLKRSISNDARWTRDQQLRRDVIDLVVEYQSVRRLIRRLLHSDGDPSDVALLSAIVKLTNTESRQRWYDLAVRLSGVDGQIKHAAEIDSLDNPMISYINSFGGTISGGSNEIMRNIIAERGLGLPR